MTVIRQGKVREREDLSLVEVTTSLVMPTRCELVPRARQNSSRRSVLEQIINVGRCALSYHMAPPAPQSLFFSQLARNVTHCPALKSRGLPGPPACAPPEHYFAGSPVPGLVNRRKPKKPRPLPSAAVTTVRSIEPPDQSA
jgi:hypothetical protein